MKRIDALDALRRANPRSHVPFVDATRAGAEAARPAVPYAAPDRTTQRAIRWRRVGFAVAVSVLVAAMVGAAVLVGGSPGAPITPAAAMQRAARTTAAAADDSGTVGVRMTKDGEPWTASTVRWNGGDLSVTYEDGRSGRALLVVDGTMYGPDPEVEGSWLQLGSPDSIDPGSGTTPDEYLTAVKRDAGGDTLRAVTAAMADLVTVDRGDGSTVYRGHVAAGLLAPMTGEKEGQTLRILPYGYVAHDAAADPASPIAVSLTVGPDGTIRELLATWGGGAEWTYRLTFTDLGATPTIHAPANARSLGR